MSQTIQAITRKRRRDWKDPFEWLDWYLRKVKPTVLFRYDTGSGRETGTETFSRGSTATYVDSAGLVQTAASGIKRDRHYIGAAGPLLLLEGARTNICLWNRDLTNAAWTATTCTVSQDQTGADGTANSASSLLATAANATVLQAITDASKARYQSAYVKRLVGTGTVNMTLDNGTTWTAITLTTDWTRVTIPTQTLANPTVGFRLVTDTDKIAVDFVQTENGTFQSSVIATTSASVTRSADVLSFVFPFGPQEMTVYADIYALGVAPGGGNQPRVNVGSTSNANARFMLVEQDNYGSTRAVHVNDAAAQVQTAALGAAAYGDRVEQVGWLYANGSVNASQSINSAAATTDTQTAANTMSAAWSSKVLNPAGSAATVASFRALRSLRIAAGIQTLATMRSL